MAMPTLSGCTLDAAVPTPPRRRKISAVGGGPPHFTTLNHGGPPRGLPSYSTDRADRVGVDSRPRPHPAT